MKMQNAPLEHFNINTQKSFYLTTKDKFIISNLIGIVWFLLSCYISYPWVNSLAQYIGYSFAWYIVLFIALIPGYLNMFLLFSLLMDRPPKLKLNNKFPPVSLLMAVYNEEECITETLDGIKQQDYSGKLEIVIVDDGSTDKTKELILNSDMPNIKLINAQHRGKSFALNKGLKYISNEYTISIDADTFLHPQAVKRIMARILRAPLDTVAVAGCVLDKNSRDSFMARLQEWDYFLAISSVKRQQALYQGTLVAQGALSVFKTKILKKLNGWPACIGEDIVLTWAMIKAGYRIGFEATAVGFTKVPITYKGFARQRKRWARGMIKGFKNHISSLYKKRTMSIFMISLDLLFPIIDFTYTFVFIPGIFLALKGYFWIVGPMTLTVLPIALFINYIMYKYQSNVFSELGLKIRKNKLGFIAYILFYQMIMSPACVLGYTEELLGFNEKW